MHIALDLATFLPGKSKQPDNTIAPRTQLPSAPTTILQRSLLAFDYLFPL